MGAKEYISNKIFKSMIKDRLIRKDFILVQVNPDDDRDVTLIQAYHAVEDCKFYISKWFMCGGELVKLNEDIPFETYQNIYDDYLKFIDRCKKDKDGTIYMVGKYKSMCSVYTDVPMMYRKLYKLTSDAFSFALKDNRG